MTTENTDNPRRPTGDLPNWQDPSTKPVDEKQADPQRFACKDTGMVDCGYELESADMDEVRDALQAHYIDTHPGHQIDDAYMLTLADRNRF